MILPENEILSLNLQHNFWTWSAQAHVDPILVSKSQGVYFWDEDGKRYLDFNSMVMNVNIGHGNQHVMDAMVDQIRELPFAGPGMATKPRALLGKMLAEITPPGLDRFLYTLGGSDANENAVKLARAATGKAKILTRYRSYHGATAGSMALTGDPRRIAWEPLLMPGVVHFLDPYRYRSTFHRTQPEIPEDEFCLDYLNHLEEIIQFEGPGTIAGILMETVTGTNGIIIPPEGYLQGVREICNRYGILMIADEVMSGFGRTGRWFAVDNWSVKPDLMTMAKGLTSGYAPLGAVAMTERVASAFNEKTYQGGLTYNGHPVSLAAAVAVIQVMQDEHLVERSAETGKVLADNLSRLRKNHICVGETRSIGLFGAIELVRNRETREPLAPYNGSSPAMNLLKKYLFDKGLYIYTHWHTLLVIPPLIITPQELEEGFSIIDAGLDQIDQSLN